jgi:CheY-like chemotaxis protein/anti-sigma regulatory factor (Ser/Thr protein kinase)
LEASRDQLTRQAAELAQQDRHREEFLAALGHELRNPLAALQSSIPLINASDDRSRKALAVLGRQTQHMTRLINDLLDVTRVRHGRVDLQRTTVDLNQALASAVEAVRPRAESKGLTIECAAPATPVAVDADAERLAQVLDNLLRNAVNYTDAGVISVQAVTDGPFARISVKDTGTGIEASDIPHLFEPYQRGGRNRHGEGLGLGLAVVKSLIERHGGTVSVHSAGAGAGSEFTFTLPLATTDVAAPAVGPLVQPPALRVLVVDDQRDVADMLAGLLETLGQQVTVAYDTDSALSLARRQRPQVAFLDVTMPGASGAELTHRLREEFPPSELMLVAVTGHEKDHAGVRVGQFDHHVLKPIAIERIIAVLKAAHGGGSSTP